METTTFTLTFTFDPTTITFWYYVVGLLVALITLLTFYTKAVLWLDQRWQTPRPDQVEQRRENRQAVLSLADIATRAFRAKMAHQRRPNQNTGPAVSALADEIKNLVAHNPRFAPQLWKLVKTYATALRDPLAKNISREFKSLMDEIRRLLDQEK